MIISDYMLLYLRHSYITVCIQEIWLSGESDIDESALCRCFAIMSCRRPLLDENRTLIWLAVIANSGVSTNLMA